MNTHSPIPSVPRSQQEVHCINFNQDQGCFAVGHEEGFLVYNSNPIDLRVKRQFTTRRPKDDIYAGAGSLATGIGHITMLHRTNYLALVGGGKNPRFPPNKLIIWDDLKRKTSLTLEFPSPVLNVLLSRVRIIVVLRKKVLVYGFEAPPKEFASYDTIDNELGIADLSVNCTPRMRRGSSIEEKFQTLAFPGKSEGQVQIVDVSSTLEKSMVSIIKAHKSRIRCLALNRSGALVATASETGTLIRVHSTHNNALVYEFRRGIDRAAVQSIRFSHNDSRLAVLSDKHTIHVFNLLSEQEANRRHLLRSLSLPVPIPNYFNSTWSLCSVNTEKYSEGGDDEGTLGWSGSDTVIVVWKRRRMWEKYVVVERGERWEVVREGWKNFGEELSTRA